MEWYNENELRAYPLYESSTRVSSAGIALPDDIVVDLNLTVPRDISDSLYFSSIVVTPLLVAVAISRAGAGIAAGAWKQPVSPYTPYALSPLVGVCSGHIVFGKGVSSQARFIGTDVVMAGLDDRPVHPVEGSVVLSVGRYMGQDSDVLSGVVRLLAGNNITIRWHDNKLKVGLVDIARSTFVGPCDRRAVFDNCGYPPIRTINGVGPDTDGSIGIEVDNSL